MKECVDMSKESITLIIAYAATLLMLIKYVPRDKLRQAFVIFSFKQLITWLVGIAVVELGLIEYPADIFQKAVKTSFTFEYFIYPSICVVFNLHYPNRKRGFQLFMYYFYFCSVMTLIEHLLEVYTDLIHYTHWNWFITWITLFITFAMSRRFYIWFYRID